MSESITIEDVTKVFSRTTRFLMDQGMTEMDAKAKAKEIMAEACNQIAKENGSELRFKEC